MLIHWDALCPLLGWSAPGQEDDTVGSHLCHGVNHFLHEQFPAFARMRVCFASANSQAGIDEQHAPLGPRNQQSTFVWRWLVVWVFLLKGFVDVLERGWGGVRWTDGEAEAVGLVGAVIRILACDDYLDCVKRCVSRPILACQYVEFENWGYRRIGRRTMSKRLSLGDRPSCRSPAPA